MVQFTERVRIQRDENPVELVREYFSGKPLSGDFSLHVTVYPARFLEQAYFDLSLVRGWDGARSRDPLFSGVFSAGRVSQMIPGWIDGDYFDTASFPDGSRVFISPLGLDASFFKILGDLVPPGGSLMVSYSLLSKEARIHRETKLGLDRGYPPAVTPLGYLLFLAGCGMGFKDWYFAEGGREGPEKLQGYKPSNEEAAKKKAGLMLQELRAFMTSSRSVDDELARDCRERAEQVMHELRIFLD